MYLALALPVTVLAQRPSAAAGHMGTATAGTAERQEADIGEGGAGRGSVRGDVFQAAVSVDTEHVFDFIIDPQQLIQKTGAAAYNGSRFEEDATLFFKRSDGKAETEYSSSSDALTIVNQGETDITVILSASISPDSIPGITMSDDPGFPDNTGASLYLALTDGETTVPIDSESGAAIETKVQGVSPGGYANEYSFWLMGAANKEGDWLEVTDAAPKITVTWMIRLDEEDVLGGEEWEAGGGLPRAGGRAVEREGNPAETSGGAEESTASAESNPAAEETDTKGGTAAGQEMLGGSSASDGNNAAKDEGSNVYKENIGGNEGVALEEKAGEDGGSASGEKAGENGSGSFAGDAEGTRGSALAGDAEGTGGSALAGDAEGTGGSTLGGSAEEDGSSASEENAGSDENGTSVEKAGGDENGTSVEKAGGDENGTPVEKAGGDESGASGEHAGEYEGNVFGESAGADKGSASENT